MSTSTHDALIVAAATIVAAKMAGRAKSPFVPPTLTVEFSDVYRTLQAAAADIEKADAAAKAAATVQGFVDLNR